ncbi:hypothetical protein EON73_01110 [bacterium]|nr:MAG: hypothetical protein EON73_01110 [bacterium]
MKCIIKTQSARRPVSVLLAAITQLPNEPVNLTHHSDKAIQYCCEQYIFKLNAFKINISMTENGNPLENMIAERVNGILKNRMAL